MLKHQKKSGEHWKLGSVDGKDVYAVLMPETRDRLRCICFRGKGMRKAGNFSRLVDARHVSKECSIDEHVIASIRALGRQPTRKTGRSGREEPCMLFRAEIRCSRYIGWSTTSELARYEPWHLERFCPNGHASAWRVRRKCPFRAPATNIVTWVYELVHRQKNGVWLAIIHDLHPGPDTGVLRGDVSAQRQIVFFDTAHPGERIRHSPPSRAAP